jgi:hypothetical protein
MWARAAQSSAATSVSMLVASVRSNTLTGYNSAAGMSRINNDIGEIQRIVAETG